MREILFRGKDIAGNWYAGNLAVVKEDMHNGAGTIKAGSYISNEYGKPFAYQIRPETVSQFTGLTDKNGKRVFEGDIVRIEDFVNAAVKWREDIACWTLQGYIIGNTWGSSMLEVIGNTHDNPELLT